VDAFTVPGVWWLPDSPDENTAGIISFNPNAGTRLELIGTLGSPGDAFAGTLEPDGRRYPVIHGVADASYITLLDCLSVGSKIQSPGLESEDFTARFLLRGSELVEEGCRFNTVELEFDYLAEWSGLGGLTFPQPEGPDSEGQDRAEVRFRQDRLEVQLENGYSIAVGTRVFRDFALRSFQLQASCALSVTTPEPLDLDELGRNVLTRCQNLLTLTTDTTCAQKKMVVLGPEGHPLEVGSQLVYVRRGEAPSRTVQQMLLAMGEIDFADLVTRWFALYDRCERPLNTLFGLLYAPPSYVELKLTTSAAAAEGLHSGLATPDPAAKQANRDRKQAILDSIESYLSDKDFDWIVALLSLDPPSR
jgi:hypothetical protein